MEYRESLDIDINHYLLMVKRQFIPAASIFMFTVFLSGVATTRLQPSYEAEGKLLFKLPSFQILGANISRSSGSETGDLQSLVSTQNPINTEREVIYSPDVLQRTIEELKLKDNEGKPLKINALASSLTLKIVPGTDVLKISYQSRNRKESAMVVNTIMKQYLNNDVLTTRKEAEKTYQFMARQLPKVQSDVSRAELELRRFKQKNDIVDLSEETKSAIGIIGELESKINTVQAQLDDINAQTNALRQKIAVNSQQVIAATSLSNSAAVQGILTKIQEIEREIAIERSRYFDDNPIIVSLEAKKVNLEKILKTQIANTVGSPTEVPSGALQIGSLQQKLIQDFLQAEVQRVGLSKQLASLKNSHLAYKRRMKIIPMLVQSQRDLERKVEVAQSTYETILKKVQELQVAQNQNTANARIIAMATVPENSTGGKKMILIVMGILLGSIFASTTIILLEMRDRTLKTVQEIKQKYDYNLLGILPLLTHKKKAKNNADNPEFIYPDLTVINAPESPISEKYRMIQANLKSLNADKPLDTIVVTSAMTGEGKSTFTANLGASISQLGKRVLIIDADMRTPSQHNIWKVPNELGLSSVLLGEKDFYNSGQHITDNLDILTSGHQTANPLALIDSQQMPLL
ncbi:MAG: polysaccharide biosynthesis tyrosine autokinase, partial [Sphaerospermopsis sp. SIO1G2]|nr:polysaccharide biosynthesis tyrosine autokinase [Sphaerospermopsis sp. SIO1G2]